MKIENQNEQQQINLEAFNLDNKKQDNIQTKGLELKQRIFLEEGETFEDPVLCFQCQGILVEPRNCQQCENYFCKECIEKIASQNNGMCNCGCIYKNEEPHKLINKMLSRLRFVCINEKNGCDEKITYENIDEHTCPFEVVNCQNEECKKQLLRKDFLQHKNICPFKNIICEYCQQNYFLIDKEKHDQNCEKKPLKCSGCLQTFYQYQFQEHFQNCQEVEQTCNNCSKRLKRKQMKNHTEVQCLYYYFLQKEQRMNLNLTQLKKTIAYLNSRLVEEEQYFGTKCINCEKYCCEASRKVCQICRSIFCIICSRKKIKYCNKCHSITCYNCNTGLDFCKICANQKKEENEKNQYLSSARKRSKRGRPRKVTNSFIIDQLNYFKLNQNDRKLI